jgi:glutathione reductase (NADPH)
MVDAQTGTAM